MILDYVKVVLLQPFGKELLIRLTSIVCSLCIMSICICNLFFVIFHFHIKELDFGSLAPW